MDIPDQFEKLTKQQKKYKLKPFTDYYYSRKGRVFKFLRIPYWINTYGYWMRQENSHKLPKYYRIFDRGTVVMVDFGVQVASEFCGPHFAIALNRHDDKYNPVITVIPLSSKDKPWYANLGTELLERITEHFDTLESNADASLKDTKQRVATLYERFGNSFLRSFNDEDSKILIDAGVAHDHDHLNFTITFGERNIEARHYIDRIRNAKGFDHSQSLQNYVVEIDDVLNEVDHLQDQLNYVKSIIPAMQSLITKRAKYNKPTFANTRNITTVSKLRVVKFSSMNVSENIKISDAAMQQVESKINNYI